ncbi:MAG: T9SS type A sorting domain-containing protein [Bacteroidetes bacterium]|nr:T9SS type A sorting domain-containing protein [Bacteroidota bacterium]
MIEVINMEGMPVYKYRAQEEDSFSISELEGKGLPCGIYFVRIKKANGIETAKLLIC